MARVVGPTRESAMDRKTLEQQAEYKEALRAFDSAVCEALAVSQAPSGRLAAANVGWGSYIFAQLCARAVSMVRAAPRSRWVQSDSEDWSFPAVAGHARAIMEGYLFFVYLMDTPSGEEELSARINVMHLNDCTRRVDLMALGGDAAQAANFAQQQEELRTRLKSNQFFKGLPPAVQRSCLSGQKPWIKSREQILDMADFPADHFNVLWIHYSQHTHILPMSFYRMEPNGRGSGVENEADRDFFCSALQLGKDLLARATDKMVEEFPDTAPRRRGILSVFSPGPRSNKPQEVDLSYGADGSVSVLSSAIAAALKGGADL